MKRHSIAVRLLTAAITSAVVAVPGVMPALAADAGNTQSLSESITVTPDDDGDFDAYTASVVFTITDGSLTNIGLSSEWGAKTSQNQRYSTNALSGIGGSLLAKAGHIRMIDEKSMTVDTVSGATCSSSAIQGALLAAAEQAESIGWTGISSDLTCSVNGTAIELNSSAADDDDDDAGSGQPGGEKPAKDPGITLEDGYGIGYKFLSASGGDLSFQMVYTLPEGYSCNGINLVRVNNSAYMQMKEPEAFAEMFAFDAETGILTVHTENSVKDIETGTLLTVSLKVEGGGQSGNVNVAVPILSPSTITLADKMEAYTGKPVEIDAAAAGGGEADAGSKESTAANAEANKTQTVGTGNSAGSGASVKSTSPKTGDAGAAAAFGGLAAVSAAVVIRAGKKKFG